jgi:hypothetical protein
LPEYLMAGSLVSGGLSAEKERQVAAEIEEGQQSERQWGALFEQGIEPASSGLMHKDMKMDKLWEEEESLSRRSEWSQYTPSCGHAWNNRWSAQDYSWAEP